FEQITRDHVVEIGGYRYPARALGMDMFVDIDYACISLNQGDIFLFTTQAVQGTLMPSDYVSLIRQGASDLDAACERLAETARQRALEQGYGGDQFCFQLVRIDGLTEADDQQAPARLDDERPIPPELGVGDVIDALEVREVLSWTTHSRVYQVRDRATGRDLVMKAPSPELSRRSAYLEHFLLQQSIIRNVDSPHVVRSVKPSQPRQYLYYLMEYIEGVPLTQWIQRHPEASIAQRLAIGHELGKGLQALHQRDLVHQQIYPGSVIVEAGGRVVLVDFSACHPREPERQRHLRELLRQVGMTEHSAPEYALDDEVGRRSDQYSLASTLYWLLTGELPYGVPMRDLVSHTDLESLEYRSARHGNPEVSARLDAVLKRALSPQRERRYRRLSEFLEALCDAQRPLRKPRRWFEPPWLWQGIVVGLLALSSAVWLLR
ncbi:MAG TPA: protein kinase, partial [Halomonas sp.]|nr:protein kinase [Halomonas sp.]